MNSIDSNSIYRIYSIYRSNNCRLNSNNDIINVSNNINNFVNNRTANNIYNIFFLFYIIYIIFAYILAQKLKMKMGPTILLLLAGTIPIMTFFVERWMMRTYIAPALASESAPSEQQPVAR